MFLVAEEVGMITHITQTPVLIESETPFSL